MSEDEMVVLFVALGVALWVWITWYAGLWQIARPKARPAPLQPLFFAPLLAALLLFGIMTRFASYDVRDAPAYLLLYMLLGAAWVGGALRGMAFFGIRPKDDVAERANAAAGHATVGAVIGLMLAFAGANIGDGPGWWVVVFCAALSTGGFYVFWALLETFTRISETVTVERDESAGARLAGYLIAAGLVLGRGAAGNWVSGEGALLDLARVSWPLIFLVAAAGIWERLLRPTPDRPGGSGLFSGVIMAVFHVAVAGLYVAFLGPW